MSLTSMLKHKEIVKVFKSEFPLDIRLEGKIRAAPVTGNYTLVGSAFDYLLRFWIERHNKNVYSRPWIAEDSLELSRMTFDTKDPNTSKPSKSERRISCEDRMEKIIAIAKNEHRKYMNSGTIDDSLIKCCILLAQCDVYMRSGTFPKSLGTTLDGDVQDLKNLIAIADRNMFQVKDEVFLNPQFGDGSELVGGADADLIIDDTLVDIKTTKRLKFTQDHYNQIIGYYILSKIGKVNDKYNPDIRYVGIYFSRYGILHRMPVSDIENATNFAKFTDWFAQAAKTMFPPDGEILAR